MRKVIVIAKREYTANVRSKAFLVSLILMPILMGGGIIAQKYLQGKVDVDDKTIVVIDGTGKLFEPLVAAAKLRNDTDIFDETTKKQNQSKYVIKSGPAWPLDDAALLDLSDQANRDQIAGFVVLPPGMLSVPKQGGPPAETARFHGKGIGSEKISDWIQYVVQNVVHQHRLAESGMDPAAVAVAMTPVSIQSLSLYTKDAHGSIIAANEGGRMVTFFVPMAVMMLMFMSMMMSQTLLQSALEEKQQRIAEVLLGSVSPFTLMLGKLLGSVGVALTISTVYLIGGYWSLRHYGYQSMIPSSIATWVLVYQALGVLMFGSIFIAIGSACTDLKEAQSLLTPVMLLLVFPMFIWINVLQDPTGTLAVSLSLFPPATPMLMPMRMAASQGIPLWQPLAGIVGVFIGSLFCVFAAGRIFRIGILSQGKAPKLHQLVQWAIRG